MRFDDIKELNYNIDNKLKYSFN